MKRTSKTCWPQAVVTLFLVLYGALIILYANFSPTDDVVFLNTLMQGHTLIAWGPDSVQMGRFALFGAQEYNLMVLLSLPASPYTLFSINLLQFVLFSALLIAVLRSVTDRWTIIMIAVLGFCLLPGSTMSWFRLSVGERDIMFYLAIFVFTYLWFMKTGGIGYMITALLAANAAMYCKEPMFLAVGALAFSHLAGTWKESDTRQRLLDALLICSAVVFIGLYYFLVYQHRGPHLYTDTQQDPLISFFKNLANYSLFSDSVIILLLFPLAAWRAYRAIISRGGSYQMYDSLLLAAVTYAAAYVILNIYQPYYLIPAYVFGVPALVHFVTKGDLRTHAWKWATGLVLMAMIVNTLPAGVHYLARSKYLAVNYNETVKFLAQEVRSRYPQGSARIFMDGVDARVGIAQYYLLGEFLKYKGLRGSDFDLLSRSGTKCRACRQSIPWKVPDLYSVYKDEPTPEIKPGDYLVIPADADMNIDDTYLESLKRDYRLVFRTYSRFNVPLITAKTALKYILLTIFGQHMNDQVIVGRNLLNNPDYYVYIRQ